MTLIRSGGDLLVWRTELLWDQRCCWGASCRTWRLSAATPAANGWFYLPGTHYPVPLGLLIWDTSIWDRKETFLLPTTVRNEFNATCHVVSVSSTSLGSSSTPPPPSILWENTQLCHPFSLMFLAVVLKTTREFWCSFQRFWFYWFCCMTETSALKKKKFPGDSSVHQQK